MATVVWWLIKRQPANVQPWVVVLAQNVHGAVLDRPAAKTALWVFMAVATSLFALFVSAYAMRIGYLDWRPMPQPRLLTLDTAFVLASIAMQWSVSAARAWPNARGAYRHGGQRRVYDRIRRRVLWVWQATRSTPATSSTATPPPASSTS